jgi:dynein heavy chain 1, cytosolic
MSRIRDLPLVVGSIIWAKQIERQLSTYLKRVEHTLGKGWETHVDGQKLKAEGENFMRQLNTQSLFDEWLDKAQQKTFGINGKIYFVEQQRAKTIHYKLRVNFASDVITLAKEVRSLKMLGFRIPLSIVNKAHQLNQIYPYAISLIECISLYDKINTQVKTVKKIKIFSLCPIET